MSKELRFLRITAKHQDFFLPYHYNDKNFIPKYPNNALIDFVLTSLTSRRLLEKKVPVNDFLGTVPSAEKYCCIKKKRQWRRFVAMTDDNSVVIKTLLMTNFHLLYLIKLW